ncbi:peflin or Penta-EF hand domain-containing protein 1 [Halocaridina rubra]|uniref:Peflin or Penta-EF hand domain-containing protein 1 n=1 Tax=Halocaridina rubra TaxID=373956 RepID=A0AAN8XM82_HALRR
MNFNQYPFSQSGYPPQTSAAPTGAYPSQTLGAPPLSYASQASGATPTSFPSKNPVTPSGGYPGQAQGTPSTGYPGQVPGAPSSGYPGQIPGAPFTGHQSQAQGPNPAPYGGSQPMQQHQAASYPGQQTVGGFPGAPPPNIDPNVASWFRAVDQDNSGEISAAELRVALQNGNWSQFTEEACNFMISMFDKNHSGTINLQEFGQLFAFVNEWIENYQRYDQDKSGTICEKELHMALQQMGYRFSSQFVGFLISKYSPRARVLTLDNFILINIKLRNLTEAFRSQDHDMKGVVTINYEQFLNMTFASMP